MDYTLRCTIFRGFAKKREMKGCERGKDDSWGGVQMMVGWGWVQSGVNKGTDRRQTELQTGDKQRSNKNIQHDSPLLMKEVTGRGRARGTGRVQKW